MKILFIIETLSKKGGAERVLISLIIELLKLGYSIHVAVLWEPYDLETELLQFGVKIHKLSLSHRWNLISGSLKLRTICCLNRFDLIHGHLFFAELYTALSFFYSRHSVRIVTFHNLGYDSDPVQSMWNKIRKFLHVILIKYFINFKSAVSKAAANSYALHLNIKGIEVINNGVPDIANALIKEKRTKKINCLDYKQDKNDFCIIVAGRLIREKGHFIMLEALAILKNENISPRVLFIGDGPLELEIKESIRKYNLADTVSIIPTINQNRLFTYISESNLVVLPSIYEGLPTIIIEAMMLGVPVIGTTAGGIPEIIEDEVTGLVVQKNDPFALAMAIKRVMFNDVILDSLSRNCIRSAKERFSINFIAGQWDKKYKELVAIRK